MIDFSNLGPKTIKTSVPNKYGRVVAMIEFKGQVIMACEHAIYQLIEQDMVFKKIRFEDEEEMCGKPIKIKKETPKVFDFEVLWSRYPRKLGKDEALRWFKAQVRTEKDYADINQALTNFLASKVCAGDPQYIPHGATWFNKRWRDWIIFRESESLNASDANPTAQKLGLV